MMRNFHLRFKCMNLARAPYSSCSQSSKNVQGSDATLSTNAAETKVPQRKKSKTSSTFCIPALDTQYIQSISSVLSVNLRLDSISWSKLCKEDNHLTDWGLVHLPHDIIRMDQIKLFDLLLSIRADLPTADIYVMEQVKQRQGSKNPGTNVAFLVKLQMLSMLIPMFSATYSSDPSDERRDISSSKVALLKPYLASKLFNLLVADEQIAVEPIVKKVLNNEPCRTHSPLLVSNDARHSYKQNRSPFDRENMGIALLMNITFMELLVHENPDSYTILLKNFDEFVKR